MSPDSVIVMGTLKADGTLELDESPTLAPGRVRVAIVPARSPAAEQPRRTILDVLDGIQAAQAARGYRGRSIEEMQTDEARGGPRMRSTSGALADPLAPDDARDASGDARMTVYLDSMIVIYLVEGPDPFGSRRGTGWYSSSPPATRLRSAN